MQPKHGYTSRVLS